MRERGSFKVLLNTLLIGPYGRAGKELTDLFDACAQRFSGIARRDDTLFYGLANKHEHAPGEAFKGVHVELPQVRPMNRVSKRLRKAARRHLRQLGESGAIDQPLLELTTIEKPSCGWL